MYVLYRELGGTAQLKYTCQSCCLQLTKYLGKLYFEYEENLMKEPEVSDDETKAKKKRGRKKKEDK